MLFFGTLMWIDEENHSSPNNKNKNVYSYFRQIKLLSHTLGSRLGTDLVIFTNNKEKVEFWFNKNKVTIKIIELIQSITVPHGTSFFSAHYKLDALVAGRDLLQEKEDRFILLDTDVIAIHKLSDEQTRMISKADLIVYDISDQVYPAYGAERIIADVELIAGSIFVDPRWFGGEFIAGSKLGLSYLIDKTREVLPRYFENIGQLHHVGDEMFITASINMLLLEPTRLQIMIQNPYRLISRHWSRHTDRPLSFHMQHSFIHCPGSKPVIELLSSIKITNKKVIYLALLFFQQLVILYHFFNKKSLQTINKQN